MSVESMTVVRPGGRGCLCEWPEECDGVGLLSCKGCGGDICCCLCGGSQACPGCEQCEPWAEK